MRRRPGILYLIATVAFVVAGVCLIVATDTWIGTPAVMFTLAILCSVLTAKYWGTTRE